MDGGEDLPVSEYEVFVRRLREIAPDNHSLTNDEVAAFPPGYVGGLDAVYVHYEAFLHRIVTRPEGGAEVTPTGFVRAAYPNTFLSRGGVQNVVDLRRRGAYWAAENLELIDDAYVAQFQAMVKERGLRLREPHEDVDEIAELVGFHMKTTIPRYWSTLDRVTLRDLYAACLRMSKVVKEEDFKVLDKLL
ncbi:MAG: hypothetical protein HY556_02805 [Euryarchaeota archaeon]|nr:hypothetical protein [Euryarchaeota archaeon]